MGIYVLILWFGIIEIVGRIGFFDYIEFVGEYVIWSFDFFDNFGCVLDFFFEMLLMMKVEE